MKKFWLLLAVLAVFTVFAPVNNPADVGDAGFDSPPKWVAGEEWHYVAFLPEDNDKTTFYDLTWTVISTTPPALKSNETKGGHDQINFYTDSLAWVGVDGAAYNVMQNGKKFYTPLVRHTPPLPFYSWPLELGKKWELDVENKIPPGGKHRVSFEVLKIEHVNVPAGTFLSALIEYRLDGHLTARRWYAPAVKNIVKVEHYFNPGTGLKLTEYLDRFSKSK